jgi:hypothetical protein
MPDSAIQRPVAHAPKTAQSRRSASFGTAGAIYSDSYRWQLAPRSDGRGGPRNRADRYSLHLSRRQVGGLIEAASFALATGRLFQRHWTVHYEAAGIAESEAALFIGKLLNLVSKQAKRAGGELTALWVRENGHRKGGHVHILMALPAGLSLRNRTGKWIQSAGGNPARKVSKVRTIGSKLANVAPGAHYLANGEAVLGYLLKGADAATGHCYRLDRYGEGGPITGKRCGWTQNVGRTARAATGFTRLVKSSEREGRQ